MGSNRFVSHTIIERLHSLEHFVDKVCDDIMINESYRGNILMVLTELFSLHNEINQSQRLSVSYMTNYQEVEIFIQSIDNQIHNILNNEVDLNEIENDRIKQGVFLVQQLADKIELGALGEVLIIFDISAIHDKVFKMRAQAMNSYFTELVKSKNY